MSFSERKGLKRVRDKLQVGSIDDALRASLWNLLHIHVWDESGFLWSDYGDKGRIVEFAKLLWFRYFKRPFSDIPGNPYEILNRIEHYFLSCPWNEVYDFLETVVAIEIDPQLAKDIHRVLERELSGYRLLDGHFVDVTDPKEIAVLEEALGQDQFAPVAAHLSRALELLADRKNPRLPKLHQGVYIRIRELVRLLTKKEDATLADALRLFEKSSGLHPALREAFSRMYGYTSDANGIRHAMLEEPNLNAADAKFFLLSCTSFVNYLKSRVGSAV